MGGRGSKEAREAGVGVQYVLLTGRRSSGKSRLLSALGKRDWSARGGGKADRESHVYNGMEMTKLSTNVAGMDLIVASARDIVSRAADEDGNTLAVWFMIDEARSGDLTDAGRDLAALARALRPLRVPLWVIVNVLDRKVLSREHFSGYGVEAIATLTRMRPEDVAAIRGVVRRILRVNARDAGRDAGLGGIALAKAGAPDISQLLAALKGKHDFDA